MRYHQGVFKPTRPHLYVGNPAGIVYRSSWELRFFKWIDTSQNVLSWSSEELAVPYRSPLDDEIHRYFPDVIMKVQTKTGPQVYMIEVKPDAQTRLPKGSRNTPRLLREVQAYAVNQAKWRAADHFCRDQGWLFKIMTEHDLGLTL